jgi:tetratricopeptide (TPR) repeat protein
VGGIGVIGLHLIAGEIDQFRRFSPLYGEKRRNGLRVYTRLFVADDVYDLFKKGTALLEAGEFHQATVPLSKAAAREPEKTSIREALGRAYFRSRQFEQARVEFEAVVDRAPTNDYALFCLGRALLELGRPKEARKPLTLAAQLRPERRDYRIYRERAAKAA